MSSGRARDASRSRTAVPEARRESYERLRAMKLVSGVTSQFEQELEEIVRRHLHDLRSRLQNQPMQRRSQNTIVRSTSEQSTVSSQHVIQAEEQNGTLRPNRATGTRSTRADLLQAIRSRRSFNAQPREAEPTSRPPVPPPPPPSLPPSATSANATPAAREGSQQLDRQQDQGSAAHISLSDLSSMRLVSQFQSRDRLERLLIGRFDYRARFVANHPDRTRAVAAPRFVPPPAAPPPPPPPPFQACASHGGLERQVSALQSELNDLKRLIRTEVMGAIRAVGCRQVRSGDEEGCIICYGAPATECFYPCGHLCACHVCATRITSGSKRCPLCREFSKETIKVYCNRARDQ